MDGGCQLHKDTENKFDKARLILGQVDFINCLPVNLPIELNEVNINAKIVSSVPSKLNQMILKDEIDIAPVSSVTYIENKDKLIPVGDLCIASDGPADSVLLFSKLPIGELGKAKIALSQASSTSNRLLEIILNDFLKLNCEFEIPLLDGVIARSRHAALAVNSATKQSYKSNMQSEIASSGLKPFLAMTYYPLIYYINW